MAKAHTDSLIDHVSKAELVKSVEPNSGTLNATGDQFNINYQFLSLDQMLEVLD